MLIEVVNDLRCQIDDCRKIFGSLDDLSELRHQYESLLQDDYVVVNNIAYADVMARNISRCSTKQTRQEINRICNDMRDFFYVRRQIIKNDRIDS